MIVHTKFHHETVLKFEAEIVETPCKASLSAHWTLESGREDDIVSKYGRLSDVIVVSRPTETVDVAANLNVNAALFESGRAVLMMPPAFSHEATEKVIISWNGSVQSARAVRAAIPILERSDSVTVITIESEHTSKESGLELESYLGWHGIICETRYISGAPGVVGPKLINEMDNLRADLLVMGAYTHSRMRQLILGGVTRHIMENAEIPVFMAH